MINVALVGIGGYGASLLNTLANCQAKGVCKLVAAADGKAGELPQAKKLADENVKVFTDALAMFKEMRGKCQLAVIGTGIPSHEFLATAAARHGFCLHLEKPPAATVQEVDNMLKALDDNGVFCQVGFQAVHGSGIRFLKQRIVEGRLGELVSLSCFANWPRWDAYFARNAWAGRLKAGDTWVLDGPATNALCHQLANMLLLANTQPGRYAQPTAVRAELYSAGTVEAHTTAAIEITTAGGPKAYFLGSHVAPAVDCQSVGPIIVIKGSKGTGVYSHPCRIDYADGSFEEQQREKDPSTLMMLNLIEAVEKGDESLLRCPLAEARKAVLVIDGAHESSGRVHHIDQPHAREVVEEEGRRFVVDGMEDVLKTCADQCLLPSDLKNPPAWAVAGEEFNLDAYNHFPRRFAIR
ncbi:MAG: Gfo/Idh/MocA family oxidoreductase [Planctomycetes bacterium]|jgi:predicted dehydrogenase|nr:Gfo/Idh/MocA family oxidoreductase [Planctomycetota bacterium]